LLPLKLVYLAATGRRLAAGHLDSGYFLAKAFLRALRELPHALRRRGVDFLAPGELQRFERAVLEGSWQL
jgi:hypothetical protein